MLLSFLVSRFNVFVGEYSRRGVAGYELLDEILFRHQGRAKTVASIASSPHLLFKSILCEVYSKGYREQAGVLRRLGRQSKTGRWFQV